MILAQTIHTHLRSGLIAQEAWAVREVSLHRFLRHFPLFHDIDFECNHPIAVLVKVAKEIAMYPDERPVSVANWTREAMEARVVRYEDLRPCYNAFIDTRTPGSQEKENFTIIGPGVSENPEQYVHITEPHGFNIGGARQPPNCVNSQHSHETAEVFLVHTGQWRFDLGEHGEDAQVFVGPGDVISLRTNMFRGFTNVGTEIGYLFAILGGDDPGKVLWAPQVFELAQEHGLVLLESGQLIDKAAGQIVPDDIMVMPVTTASQVETLSRATQETAETLVWRSLDIKPQANIIGPNAPLNWSHGFLLDRLEMIEKAKVDMNNIARPIVLFVHFGCVQVSWNTDSLMLETGDTMTLPSGLDVCLSGADHGVVYRVQGQ
jgi:mannose-6-phosphate isomerase-like protein (cupin superfamily)